MESIKGTGENIHFSIKGTGLWAILLAACALFAAVALTPAGASAAFADAVYPIDNRADLIGFTDEVNGGKDFAGVTVELNGDVDAGGKTLAPIGTPSAPFKGTFDGKGNAVKNFTVSGEQYVGLFGYVGQGGQIKNLGIEGATVTASSGSKVVKCVGSLAGYVYGTASAGQAAIENCTSDATVTVTSTMDVNTAAFAELKAPEDSIGSSSDTGRSIEYIGGLTGYCAGSVNACAFDGNLTVTTHQGARSSTPVIAHAIGGVVGQVGGYVLEHYETKTLYEPKYATSDGYKRNAEAASITNCVNSGNVSTVIDAVSGVDRFGADQESNAGSVGGVVGYALANVVECRNDGQVDSPAGDATGGVAGAVRGVPVSGMTSAACDPGCYKDSGAAESTRLSGPQLRVFQCVNNGQVKGAHSIGGVVGCTGTYTRVSACANKYNSETRVGVTGTRWNKPTAGGIAGQVFGKIDHCYSHARCESVTGGGYYISGIVGSLERWGTSRNAEFSSAYPELSSCYVTSEIERNTGLRPAAICGDNYGIVRNSYYLRGKVAKDAAVGKDQGVTEDSVKMLEKAAALKTKDAVAFLNGVNSVADYRNGCYFVPDGSAAENNGYPVLSFERQGLSGRTELVGSGLGFTGEGSARYSAAENPAPKLQTMFNGSSLVQGADYFSLPDAQAAQSSGGCKDVAALQGEDLRAAIIGIGDYFTAASEGVGSASYKVEKGSFDECSAFIDTVTFNFKEQTPTKDNASVRDPAGNEVPKDSYSFELRDKTQKTINHYVTSAADSPDKREHEGYVYVFTPQSDSNYDSNTHTYGFFNIQKGDLSDIDRAAYDGLQFNGTTWKWYMGDASSGSITPGYAYRDIDGKRVVGMQIVYTGEEIRPTVLPIRFLDGDGNWRELVRGTDYRVLYGDPGEASSSMYKDADNPNTNVTTGEIGNRACVTIGSFAGNTRNFENYQNIFFDIVQADVAKDCTVDVPASIPSIGGSVKATVKGYTGATIDASNYTVTTKELGASELQVTVAGKNNLKGSVVKTVRLDPTPVAGAVVTLAKERVTYNGKAQKPAVASVVLNGATLAQGADYDVSYSKNKNVGLGKVTITGKGRCTGSLDVSFQIVPKGTKLKKLKAAKKSFTATWAKQAKQTSGYMLRYSLKKTMKGSKTVTVKKAKTTKTKVKKLKTKKTYYVQIRTYKKIGSKKYYSTWSKTKKVKTK